MLIDKFVDFSLTHGNKLLFLTITILGLVMGDIPPTERL